jgi:hypothetical protein
VHKLGLAVDAVWKRRLLSEIQEMVVEVRDPEVLKEVISLRRHFGPASIRTGICPDHQTVIRGT